MTADDRMARRSYVMEQAERCLQAIGAPTVEGQVWDALSHGERAAILTVAGIVRPSSRWAALNADERGRVLRVLERFADLCLAVKAATMAARQAEAAAHAARVAA